MTVPAGESTDIRIVDALRLEGFTVGYIAETSPGISDSGVLDRADEDPSVLITEDKDFRETVVPMRRVSVGSGW